MTANDRPTPPSEPPAGPPTPSTPTAEAGDATNWDAALRADAVWSHSETNYQLWHAFLGGSALCNRRIKPDQDTPRVTRQYIDGPYHGPRHACERCAHKVDELRSQLSDTPQPEDQAAPLDTPSADRQPTTLPDEANNPPTSSSTAPRVFIGTHPITGDRMVATTTGKRDPRWFLLAKTPMGWNRIGMSSAKPEATALKAAQKNSPDATEFQVIAAREATPKESADIGKVSEDGQRERLTSFDGQLTFTLHTLPPREEISEATANGHEKQRAELIAAVENRNSQENKTPQQREQIYKKWRTGHRAGNNLFPNRPLPEIPPDGDGFAPREYGIGSWVTWRDARSGMDVVGQVWSAARAKNKWWVVTDRSGKTGEYHAMDRTETKSREGFQYRIGDAEVTSLASPSRQLPFEDSTEVDSEPKLEVASYANYVPRTDFAIPRESIDVYVGRQHIVGVNATTFDVVADDMWFTIKVDRHERSGLSLYTVIAPTGMQLALRTESRIGAINTCVRYTQMAREEATRTLGKDETETQKKIHESAQWAIKMRGSLAVQAKRWEITEGPQSKATKSAEPDSRLRQSERSASSAPYAGASEATEAWLRIIQTFEALDAASNTTVAEAGDGPTHDLAALQPYIAHLKDTCLPASPDTLTQAYYVLREAERASTPETFNEDTEPQGASSAQPNEPTATLHTLLSEARSRAAATLEHHTPMPLWLATPPPETTPVNTPQPADTALRPSRLLYPDGSTVHVLDSWGQKTHPGVAVGSVGAPDGRGSWQVVRTPDGCHIVCHPALLHLDGTDRYPDIANQEDWYRWAAFDLAEANGQDRATLNVSAVRVGDTILVDQFGVIQPRIVATEPEPAGRYSSDIIIRTVERVGRLSDVFWHKPGKPITVLIPADHPAFPSLTDTTETSPTAVGEPSPNPAAPEASADDTTDKTGDDPPEAAEDAEAAEDVEDAEDVEAFRLSATAAHDRIVETVKRAEADTQAATEHAAEAKRLAAEADHRATHALAQAEAEIDHLDAAARTADDPAERASYRLDWVLARRSLDNLPAVVARDAARKAKEQAETAAKKAASTLEEILHDRNEAMIEYSAFEGDEPPASRFDAETAHDIITRLSDDIVRTRRGDNSPHREGRNRGDRCHRRTSRP